MSVCNLMGKCSWKHLDVTPGTNDHFMLYCMPAATAANARSLALWRSMVLTAAKSAYISFNFVQHKKCVVRLHPLQGPGQLVRNHLGHPDLKEKKTGSGCP